MSEQPAAHQPTDAGDSESCEVVTAPHIPGGHTFLVTSFVSETTTTTTASEVYEENRWREQDLKAVPVMGKQSQAKCAEHTERTERADETPSCSSNRDCVDTKAIVPLSSSLPSKLLRLHAKRSAQALLHQVAQSQGHSLDSQFGSDEGAVGGSGCSSECAPNDCADIFDIRTPTAATMSPPPPSSTPIEGLDDVGMGSSIDDSEESEEDDELKPLAVDNHVFHDIDLSTLAEVQPLPSVPPQPQEVVAPGHSTAAVLSEANLEKFHKNQHPHNVLHMDNIYLHPNFKYQLEKGEQEAAEQSPPPAVAPANSPTEQKRVHRSFLTMKKATAPASEGTAEKPSSVSSQRADSCSEQAINEIDAMDPALVPSEELAAEITEAVEFYFSDESILKDAFLLKHVRRNKEGFVSLKLVSSFKRVRQLTKEWRVVGNAVRRKSRKIELNDVGTKVRRLEPLPSFDETMPSRTIVACDLPLDKLTIEKVSDIFSKCGEIALIRILKPGMAIPVDVRQFMNKYPEMQQKECALVEYLESSAARDAKNLEGAFQVFDMVAPKKKTGKKAIIQVAAPVQRMVENYRYYNDPTYERTRGGSFSGVMPHSDDLRHKLKRNNSEIPIKTYGDPHHSFSQGGHSPHHSPYYQHSQHHHHHPQYHSTQHNPIHRGGYSNEHTHQFHHYQPRNSITHEVASSPNSNHSNFFAFSPRRYSNTSTISANTAAAAAASAALGDHSPPATGTTSATSTNACPNSVPVRRLSNGSDNYSNYVELTRRSSNCSENAPQRRDSNCSENCPCSRRVSDYGQTEVYRKTSQGSISSSERRFSNGSLQFERTMSNASDLGHHNSSGAFPRRMSNDFNCERKQSVETQTGMTYDNDGTVGGGGGGWNVFPRRYSNNFNASSKLAAYDNAQYINGRRISTDSGYDRRCSFGSEYEGSPRSRTGSFLNNYKHSGGVDFDGQPRSRTGSFLDCSPRSRSGSFALRNSENLVRTPIGPDGSKGFGSRTRKFGQTVSPVN